MGVRQVIGRCRGALPSRVISSVVVSTSTGTSRANGLISISPGLWAFRWDGLKVMTKVPGWMYRENVDRAPRVQMGCFASTLDFPFLFHRCATGFEV